MHPTTTPAVRPGLRTAWAMWFVAALVYVVAVLHRNSLGVAGIQAEDRFGIGASQLATFAVLQLVVYAGLQVPVGVLNDRLGPKKVLIAGLVVMTAGQFVFAFAHGYPAALAARVLVGTGDAMTFVSVLRVVHLWFPGQRAALLTQLTALLGMVGNLASAAPLASALDAFGWSKAFALCAGAGVLVLIALVVVLKDKPGSRSTKVEHGKVGEQIKAAWAEPGTRLGLWAHFTCGCFPQVFLLLWGFPFLVEGEGLSEGTASSLLTVAIVANMASGPFIGAMVGRRPGARLPMVVGMPVLCGILWAVVLGLPGHAPLWLLVLLSAVIGVGGPLSLVGMDFARQGNPEHRLGTVSGIVNVGGFAAAAVTLFGIGVILDALSPGDGDRSLDAFRVALSVQALPLILGLAQILRYARKVAPVKAPALVTV